MRLRAPFPLPAASELRIVVALNAALLAMAVVLLVIGLPLANAVNPAGMAGFGLAGSGARAAAIIASWDAVARLAAFIVIGIDFVFVLLYVVALATWATCVAKRLDARWAAMLGACLAWLVVLAGLADVLENVQLLMQLEEGASDVRARAAFLAGCFRFGVVGATLVYAACGTLRLAVTGAARAARSPLA
jgi:hypothetical protein